MQLREISLRLDIKPPYPGFPTDIQSPFAAFDYCRGTSVVRETVFEIVLCTLLELNRMGAIFLQITVERRMIPEASSFMEQRLDQQTFVRVAWYLQD